MNWAIRSTLGVLAWMSLTRGVDYLTGNEFDMGRLMDDNLPLPEAWGWGCVVLAVVAVAAAWTGSPRVAMHAGVLGLAVNVMLAVQIFDVRMMPWPWPPEDARIITDHLAHAAMWVIVAGDQAWREAVEKKKSLLFAEMDQVSPHG